ncbi:MAG: type II and III secretion system protein [Pseudomonadales bacterium]|nr:type II and III secretion system protein [Pseudomonadales bacterium]
MKSINKKNVFLILALSGLVACDALPPATMEPDWEVENRHLEAPDIVDTSEIPEIVRDLPVVTAPQVEAPLDLYSVVVQDVPVRELLFAMARDANINIDVHSTVEGTISINAIDQTLPQILNRISNQVDILWTFERPDYLSVQPDLPVLRSYQIDYVNVTRSSASEVSVSSAVTGGIGEDSGGGGESNNSTTLLTQNSANAFWTTLANNLTTILGEDASEEVSTGPSNIVISPESGLVTVRATNRQHFEIYDFIESVRTRALYQVLIEATVVEVNLNDRYQLGVDWAVLARDNGQVNFGQDLLGLNLSNTPTSILTIDKTSGPDAIGATIQALAEFGDISVLSSPKLMALNNQTAMLRVVDNKIYFTIDVEAGFPATATSPAIPPTFTSEVHTVPVGFTMAVTPQISENDQVTLNVRPTISRIVRFVTDPNPALADASVINSIPELQIREIESILKVDSGEIAVLGRLIQDTIDSTVAGVPIAGQLPLVGDLFNYRDDNTIKTELIIFIRPVVDNQASINGDLENYREYLPTSSTSSNVLQNLNPF